MVSAYYLNEAYNEARKADPQAVRPNPLVGAVLVNCHGEVVGRGYHQQYGGPHAEVNAFADAINRGINPGDCTLYVTLEPCSHHGKTPPCTDLILQHGVKKVVIGSLDPNPAVSGVGVLIKNGVQVEVIEQDEIHQLNRVFFTNQKVKRPYFQFKLAMTADGIYAHKHKQRLWITGEETHRYVHEVLRKDADAILSTARSVINDNAKLNLRIGNEVTEKTAIVLDQRLDLLKEENKGLAIFYPRINSKLILVTTVVDFDVPLPPHVELLVVPSGEDGKICLISFAQLIYQNGYFKILIESGYVLYKSLVAANLIDESLFFVAYQSFDMDIDYSIFPEYESIVQTNDLYKFSLNRKMIINQDVLFRYFIYNK
jgi:diaminohydroxyphosphoribosylaminopyrimidine deaminase/5-amino-6-(5-phosphoribosylamino)uracil reductase